MMLEMTSQFFLAFLPLHRAISVSIYTTEKLTLNLSSSEVIFFNTKICSRGC